MTRLVPLLSAAALTACALQAVELPVTELSDTFEATLAAAELALAADTAMPDPGRGPWRNVADLAFLPGGGGVIEEGPLRFSWRLNLRNLGLDHDTLEADLQVAAEALGQLDLGVCDVAEIDLYEVETAFANETGRFNLALEPGAGQVLVGVYDPRSLEPGLAAIVLTPLSAASERRALVAHELAHHAFEACHLEGDSEEFAEGIEALFHGPDHDHHQRVATAPTRRAAPTATAEEPTVRGVAPTTAQRARPPAQARVRAARIRRAQAARAARMQR